MLIRVFLHAEFISAMKTVQNPTIFVKNAKKKKKKKKIEKWLVLVISVNFLRFSLTLFSIISEKVIENVFRWKRRQINKNEQFLNFWENQLYRKAIAFDKTGSNYALSANFIKICLLGYFCMQNSYLQWKQFKILRFSWKMQKNRKMISFGNFCSFFEIFTETLEQNIRKSHKICFLDG